MRGIVYLQLGWGGAVIAEREFLERARAMRRNPAEWEARVWRHLSSAQTGHGFRRQAAVFPYIRDFFCPAKDIAVGIGGDTHDTTCGDRRDGRMVAKGFATMRFTNLEMRENFEGVIDPIRAMLDGWPDRRAELPLPNPSPEGAGPEDASC